MSNDVPVGGPPPTPPTPPPPPGSSGAVPPPPPAMPPQGPPPGAMPPQGPPPGMMPPQGPPPGPGMMPPPGYGAPGQGYPPAYGAPRPGTPGTAIAGFVCSLVGLLFVPIIFSIAGLILSIMGRKQARQQHTPTGLATAGYWISIAGLILWGLFIIGYIILIAVLVSSGEWETTTYTIAPLLF